MKTLILDIGNSKVAAAIEVDEVLVLQGRFGPNGTAVDRAAACYSWCIEQRQKVDFRYLVVSSVQPEMDSLLKGLFTGNRQLAGLKRHQISSETPLPFELKVDQPESLGADRICNVAGACARGMRSAIIVDAGTANTYDILRDGCFEGGLIGPGGALAHRALLNAGAQLPQVKWKPAAPLVGWRTQPAIQAGSWWQSVGAVEGVLKRLRQTYGPLPVLLTGGAAQDLAPELGSVHLRPDLLMEGAGALGRAVFPSEY